MNRHRVTTLLVVCQILFSCASTEESKFESYIEEYKAILDKATLPEGEQRKVIRGKVVAIDGNRLALDSLFYQIGRLRAHSPEEVGTVVWLDCRANLVGQYGSRTGPGAFQQTCWVRILSLSERKIVAEKRFSGSPPPEYSSSGGSGDRPDQEILDYLEEFWRE